MQGVGGEHAASEQRPTESGGEPRPADPWELSVDKGGSGANDFNEFVRMMTTRIGETDTEEELMKAFHIFEHDINGTNNSDDEIDYSIKPEFYDPLLDEKDEQWMNKQRKGRISDAVLSCPACFTTLCFDCQRHEKYVTQYRAIFVVNCSVRTDQILREPSKRKRKSKKLIDSGKIQQDLDNDVIFRPVCCSVCSTEVGVFDKDEVYHFFNVIPSNS